MYGDDVPAQGQYIISKKAKPIDQQQPARKKGKKNRRKEQHQEYVPEIKHQKQEDIKPKQEVKRDLNDKQTQRKRICKQLCDIFSTFKPTTVQNVLSDCRFDKAEALEKLLIMEPDNQIEQSWGFQEPVTKRKSGDNSSTNNSEAANNLMNDVYDNWMREEINGRQFEELFEEIAQMIKEDQREQGVGVFQINSFVDECNSVKQALLVGFREELSNEEEFLADQSYPLYAQTQEFLEQKIKKIAKEEQKRQEDFPTLGGGGGYNIVDRIRKEDKRRKEQQHLFTPSRNTLPQFARQKNNGQSIFNVDNKLRSEKDMVALHKEFVDVPIYDLKFIYRVFAGDYNICREFLIKYYDSKRVNMYQNKHQTSTRPQNKRVFSSNIKKEEIDKEVEHLSYDEIRNQIDHLFKLRQAMQLTKMKIKGSNQKTQLDRLINSKQPIIRKLAQASRVKLVEEMAKKNPLYADLHGYREEELDNLLNSVTEMIRIQFERGSDKVKARRVRGRQTACLVLMTGKGLHSRGNRSILKPAVLEWCQKHHFDYEQDEDHVRVFVILN